MRLKAQGSGQILLFALLVATSPTAAQRYTTPPPAMTAEALPVSCGTEARAAIERGVALLHTQSCQAARRAFGGAADAEPDCAMAYWGQAMSIACLPAIAIAEPARTEARQLLERGLNVMVPTTRERAYLDAAARLFDPGGGVGTLAIDRFAESMASLAGVAPDDPHPAVFQAWGALSRSTVPGDGAQRQAGALVASRFGEAPAFGPAALALLMARDNAADAPAGRAAAEAYTKAAPSIPQAQHRPAHIWTRLGAWNEAVSAGEKALESAGLGASPELFHAVPSPCFAPEWLAYAYLQQGRFARAQWVVDRVLHGIDYGGDDVAGFVEEYRLRERARDLEARRAIASRDWGARSAATPERAAPPRAQVTGAHDDLSTLTPTELLRRGLDAAHAAWPGARPEAVAAALRVVSALEAWAAGPARREAELYQALVQSAVAAAHEERDLLALWLAQAESRERQMIESGELVLPAVPVQELAGDLWMQVHRYADARDAFRAALTRFPGRGRSLVGLARALDRTGEAAAARASWEAFYACWSLADPERPEVAEARASLERLP